MSGKLKLLPYCFWYCCSPHVIMLNFSSHINGGSDCGVFAIAFAMAICNGQNPKELTFNISKMRRHLCDCLTDQLMRHFPATPQRQQHHRSCRTETVQVYCRCRLQEEGPMILCEGCDTWFHKTCDNIPESAWEKDSKRLCFTCTN